MQYYQKGTNQIVNGMAVIRLKPLLDIKLTRPINGTAMKLQIHCRWFQPTDKKAANWAKALAKNKLRKI